MSLPVQISLLDVICVCEYKIFQYPHSRTAHFFLLLFSVYGVGVLQVITSILFAFSHGAHTAPNVLGPLATLFASE